MPGIRSERWRFLSRLIPYLAQHKSRLAWGFVCILLTNTFLLATPLVVKYAVNDLYESVTREKFAFYALMIVVLAICEGIFRFAMRWLLIGVSRDIEYSLRNDLFKRLEAFRFPTIRKTRPATSCPGRQTI